MNRDEMATSPSPAGARDSGDLRHDPAKRQDEATKARRVTAGLVLALAGKIRDQSALSTAGTTGPSALTQPEKPSLICAASNPMSCNIATESAERQPDAQ